MNSLSTWKGRTYDIQRIWSCVQRSGGVEQYHLCSVTLNVPTNRHSKRSHHKHCHFPCIWQGECRRQIQKWSLGDALQTASGGRNLAVQNTGCSWQRECGCTAPWWAVQLSKIIPIQSVHSAWVPWTAVPNHDLAGQEKGSRVLWTTSMVVTVNGGQKS